MRDSCENCGAPAEQTSDGRRLECTYCGPNSVALAPASLAQVLGGLGDLETMIHHLADRLARGFPDRTEVVHSGGFLSAKKVALVAIALDPHVYRIRRDGGPLVAERVDVIGGVAIKTTRLGLDEWVRELAEALARLATATAQARAALARFVSGR